MHINGGVGARLRHAALATRRLCTQRETRRSFSRGLCTDVAVNTAAGIGIFFLGDLVAQRLENGGKKDGNNGADGQNYGQQGEGKKEINRRRALVVAVAGGFFNGLPLCLSYRWLDLAFGETKLIRHGFWRTFWPAVPLKVVSAQLIYMPISTALFLFILPPMHYLLNSRVPHAELGDQVPESLEQAITCGKRKVRQSFLELFLLSWLLWPLSDAVNFCLIPLRYRPAWDSVIDIFWTTYSTLR